MAMMKNYYEILGVREDALDEEIRDRWIELVKDCHPDLEGEDPVDERIKEINEAYQVLKQATTRLEYDLHREYERKMERTSKRRKLVIPAVGFVVLLAIAGWVYLENTEIPTNVAPGEGKTLLIVRQSESESKTEANHEVPLGLASPIPLPESRSGESEVNLSTSQLEGRGLPSTRAQAEGLEVHPEPRSSTPPSKAGLRAAERVKAPENSQPAVKQEVLVKNDLVTNAPMTNAPVTRDPIKPGTNNLVANKRITNRTPEVPRTKKPEAKTNKVATPKGVPTNAEKPNREEQQGTQGGDKPLDLLLPKPVLAQVTHPKPSLLASKEEVKAFFTNYVNAYNHKNLGALITLFSPKAIQNNSEPYREIKRSFSRFFIQSQDIRYHLEDLKFEIYENAVEATAAYEIAQVVRRYGENKTWKGNIRWHLIKENGALKVLSLNYKNNASH